MSLGAIKADQEIFSGETARFEFTESDLQNQPVDITGATISFALREKDARGALKFTKTVGSGITIRDQSTDTGKFDVVLAKADTVNLSGLYYYEVGVILAGVELTTTYGKFVIEKSGVR